MKRATLLIGAALALTSAWVAAQDAPESLLPPGFDKPAARPTRTPAPSASQTNKPAASTPTSGETSTPVVQVIPDDSSAATSGPVALPKNLPSLAQLEAMTPEELDELLGLKPKFDIPAAARRSLTQVGILDAAEGGLPAGSLAGQNATLVRAALEGNKGQLVSRWGHILLRRALASRLDAPSAMTPADFAALRAALLLRMGEGEAARGLVQDIDTANFTPALTQAALDAYVATADITGICPAVALQGGLRKDADWRVLRGICATFQGEGASGMAQLDRAEGGKLWPKIDILLAQKYAGAAGKARKAVTIEWDGVSGMNPWRYALSIATGVEPPAALMRDAGVRYDYIAATAPMVGLPARAAAADRAAAAGVLSSEAMVDLYGQIYAQDDIAAEWAERASSLREAYVAPSVTNRLAAIKALWDGASGPEQRYSRQILTAYAAARMPAENAYKADASDLVASMLAAGLDRNALRWANVADEGSLAWAQLVLANPAGGFAVTEGAVSSFNGDDASDDARKSKFLLAGLAGLGRIDSGAIKDLSGKFAVDLGRQTRWTRMISGAAEVNNSGLVALLAGVGMQGSGWDKMTPLHLYHIVAALNRVGMGAEARMIAAEAVARG